MTQTTTPDKLVSAVLDAFFKGFDAPEAASQEAEPKEAGDPVTPEDYTNVNPYEEALKILADLEKNAGDFEDDLRLSIADRYIEIGRQLLNG